MAEYRGSGKCCLELLKGCCFGLAKAPWCHFSAKVSEWVCDFQVPIDELSVKVGEAQERLYITHIAGLRPCLDGGDFSLVHFQAFRGQYEAQIFHCVHVEGALLGVCIQFGLSQSSKDFSDMVTVSF